MSDARTESSWTATTAPELATWLLAQIDEDEQAAEMARRWRGRDTWRNDIDGSPEDTHIARHGPARVLAECETKRRVVELHSIDHPCLRNGTETYMFRTPASEIPDPCDTLRLLALPYADRDGYREEWKPQ